MTTELADAPSTESDAPVKPVRPRLNRRRLWIPVGIAAAVIVFTLIAALIEAPHTGSDDFLSPESSDDTGSSALADALRDQGVEVERYAKTSEAHDAASGGDVTVFLPAAEYLSADELFGFTAMGNSESTRIVLVLPPAKYLSDLGLHEDAGRIATKTVPPGPECGVPEADRAGPAAVLRQPYSASPDTADQPTTSWKFCYGGALAAMSDGGFEAMIVGAPDIFDNAHLDADGNRALATGLLGTHQRVVWLDKHSLTPKPEASPQSPDQPEDTSEPPREPIQYPGAQQTSPIYDALPGWMWAGLVGLLVLGGLAALWRGRRLSPPVTEPLPVTVPAAESVYGRARLYRRAHAYPETLRALRSGALHRILPLLHLSTQADEAEIVSAAVRRTGWSTEQVGWTLYTAQPDTESELLTIVAAVDQLVAAVESASPQGRNQ